MITGLGDATWKYIPWDWGVRAMDYTVLAWDSPQLYAQVKTDFFSGMIISVCCTVCLLIASLVWFHGWEAVSYTHLDVYKRQNIIIIYISKIS